MNAQIDSLCKKKTFYFEKMKRFDLGSVMRDLVARAPPVEVKKPSNNEGWIKLVVNDKQGHLKYQFRVLRRHAQVCRMFEVAMEDLEADEIPIYYTNVTLQLMEHLVQFLHLMKGETLLFATSISKHIRDVLTNELLCAFSDKLIDSGMLFYDMVAFARYLGCESLERLLSLRLQCQLFDVPMMDVPDVIVPIDHVVVPTNWMSKLKV